MVDRGPGEKAAGGAAARPRPRFPTIDDPRRRARRRIEFDCAAVRDLRKLGVAFAS